MMFSVEGFRTTTVYFGLYDLARAVSSQQSHPQITQIYGNLWDGFAPEEQHVYIP
jgi:hypothetical protein